MHINITTVLLIRRLRLSIMLVVMKKLLSSLLFISCFIFSQFFTEQLHEITHFFSHTECKSPAISITKSNLAKSILLSEVHDHCKFLDIIASIQNTPFIIKNDHQQLTYLAVKEFQHILNSIYITETNNLYHQSRAPPLV